MLFYLQTKHNSCLKSAVLKNKKYQYQGCNRSDYYHARDSARMGFYIYFLHDALLKD
jgi:hypothetical protein